MGGDSGGGACNSSYCCSTGSLESTEQVKNIRRYLPAGVEWILSSAPTSFSLSDTGGVARTGGKTIVSRLLLPLEKKYRWE